MLESVLFGLSCLGVGITVGMVIGETNVIRIHHVDIEVWRLIETLRFNEGASVTINSDNADFYGPNSVVEVCDGWTGWEDRRFTGNTVLEALRNAYTERLVS